ncbi:Peptidyl-prolyl cis-trans isomerase PpiD [Chondromyces apiculatus DSM 436]|uniref:peptidylprolyl isomerase n=1 Tax=Chondromyces apiculatus DSM 436 TaxID=1192034 RepID=A0A017TIF1_9BACT|nr:Peptidyl-prolyl cis-trans isomerase PpiD [Chondromyces apiculatus DSM 436]
MTPETTAAQTSSADAPAAGAADSPAARCLAAAEAARPRRADEPAKISVKHILVRHAGADRADGATRTREEACLRALEARDKVRGGADFDALVSEYSDEAGAASRAGSLGAIERADVLPPFADAAFELDRNQLSDVVETKYGFHLILRTE